nr:GEM-like protein 4 [Ipomoea batatas]
MKQNQTIKSINWAVLLNQSSRKWALPDSATQCHLSLSSKPSKTRNGKISTSLKITDSVKGKLILGAKLLRAGGVQKVFKKNFGVREGEKLLKASQCCLSTTAGPLAGLLFVSTEKVAFLSERSIRVPSSSGKSMRVHYKVLIPIAKIKTANEMGNKGGWVECEADVALVEFAKLLAPVWAVDEAGWTNGDAGWAAGEAG